MAQMASDRAGNSPVPGLWRAVRASGGLDRSGGAHLELLLLGAGVAAGAGVGVGAAVFSSTFCLAAASCSRWAPVWMAAAGTRAAILRGPTAR